MAKYSTWHFIGDTGIDDIQSFDEAIAWSLNAVRNCPTPDDENNSVSIYCKDKPDQTDRIAVVYPGMVVVNEGHGTDKWPSGWTTSLRRTTDMALIQNDIDWQNKLMEYKEKAHDKYVNETDIDDATHWAHYEGAFAAFRWTLINGGSVDEELMQEYIDAVDFNNGELKEDN